MGFATYWCPPQASARLGAGSPGGWVAPAPGPGAQRGLGSGSEQPGDGSCLPCLSLSMGEETRPGRWGAKNASASKPGDPVNVNQKEKKDEKIKKRIENWGEKDGERGHSVAQRKSSLCAGDRSRGCRHLGRARSAPAPGETRREKCGWRVQSWIFCLVERGGDWGHGKGRAGGSGAAHGRSSEGRWGSLCVAL